MSIKRLSIYLIGIFIFTLGIVLTIKSRLGAPPFDALLVGLFRTVGLTVGSWEIILGLTMVLGNAVAQRCRPEYLAVLTAFVTGACIDFWLLMLGDVTIPENFLLQLVVLLLGVLLDGVGIAIYLRANFAPNPMDRSMLVVSQLTGLSVSLSRTILSILLVILAFFFHGPIGLGTIIAAILLGPVINFFMKAMKRMESNSSISQSEISEHE